MSTLQKTDIIPPNSLDDLLNQFALKMVVIIDNEELVTKADNLSQNPPVAIERRVIWIPNPDIHQLAERFPEISGDLGNMKAFCLSTQNKVGDKIMDGEDVDYVRLDLAFIQAGLPEHN